jgi:hypothetical protein
LRKSTLWFGFFSWFLGGKFGGLGHNSCFPFVSSQHGHGNQGKSMTTHEETKVLRYLRRHTPARVSDIMKTCLPGATLEWGSRIISELEWLGYVTVHYARSGDPIALEITQKGMSFAGR